jgi:HSP20 family protein
METLQRHSGQSLIGDVLAWLNAGTEPEVRVEEWVEGDKRIIRADLPGVDPAKDIDLTVEGGLLKLSGQRREEEHDDFHTEIRYGRFERVIALPPGTTADDVSAHYENGVLTVTMPTQRALASTKIPVTHRELPVE